MGKKRKLRKWMHKRGAAEDAAALVVCVGKKCAEREATRAVVAQARAHATKLGLPVRVEVVGCLHVCEDGPIAATFPRIKFYRRVDGARACELVERLAAPFE